MYSKVPITYCRYMNVGKLHKSCIKNTLGPAIYYIVANDIQLCVLEPCTNISNEAIFL